MPDFRVRVVEVNAFYTIVRADAFEDALDVVQQAIDQADSVREDLPLHETRGRWDTDGAIELETAQQVDMHQHELTCDPELDTESSVSRQHWIETGLYLTHDEVKEYAT